MDTQSIQDSVRSLNSSIDQLGDKFDSLNSDMVRTESSAKGISASFVGVAAAGVGLFSIAKNAPAVAGSMAQMKVAGLELSMAIGESLAPAFETAAGWMTDLSGWAQQNPDLFGGIVNSVAALGVGGVAYKAVSKFINLIKKIPIPGAGGATAAAEGGALPTAVGTGAKFGSVGGLGLSTALLGQVFDTYLSEARGEDTSQSFLEFFIGGIMGNPTFGRKLTDEESSAAMLQYLNRERTQKDMAMGGADSQVVYF